MDAQGAAPPADSSELARAVAWRPRRETLEKLAHGLGVSEQAVLAAANRPSGASPAAAREHELLALYRRLDPADQVVAARLVAELARSRSLTGGSTSST